MYYGLYTVSYSIIVIVVPPLWFVQSITNSCLVLMFSQCLPDTSLCPSPYSQPRSEPAELPSSLSSSFWHSTSSLSFSPGVPWSNWGAIIPLEREIIVLAPTCFSSKPFCTHQTKNATMVLFLLWPKPHLGPFKFPHWHSIPSHKLISPKKSFWICQSVFTNIAKLESMTPFSSYTSRVGVQDLKGSLPATHMHWHPSQPPRAF